MAEYNSAEKIDVLDVDSVEVHLGKKVSRSEPSRNIERQSGNPAHNRGSDLSRSVYGLRRKGSPARDD